MNRSIQRGVNAVTLAAAGVLIMLCAPAAAETFHSASNGYSIDIPVGWERIPDDAVAEMMGALLKTKTPVPIVYETAFQRQDADHWFDYPYVLVQILPYTDFGVDRQLDIDELREYIVNITGRDLETVIGDFMRDEIRGEMSELTSGKAVLNQREHRFTWTVDMDVVTIGRVRGECTGFFGRKAIVQLLCYSVGDTDEQLSETFSHLRASFRFDSDAEYDETPPSLTGTISTNRIVRGSVTGAIVGGIAAAVFVAFRRKITPAQ